MKNIWVRRIVVAVAGFLAIFGGVFYFAWATSFSKPINWSHVVTMALVMAPAGLFLGTFPDDE
jgi:hypothetical protein